MAEKKKVVRKNPTGPNRRALVDLIAKETKFTKTHVGAVFNALERIAISVLQKGQVLSIPNVARVRLSDRKARAAKMTVNPGTGKSMIIPAAPAGKILRFRPAKALRAALFPTAV